jgi:formamidopyrimidine-DNA glycosylase
MLDQRNAAGFGNVYANDVPFITGMAPQQPVGSVDGVAELVAIGTALIRVNAARGPQNTTGRKLSTDQRWVHGLGRGRCPVCGERTEYRAPEASGWGRSITWCPACQPFRAGRVAVDLPRTLRLMGLHPAVKEPYFPKPSPSVSNTD